MRRPEGYRLRDMTRVGQISLAVAALGFVCLVVGSAVTDVGRWWLLLPAVFAGVVITLVSETRRLARQGRPSMRK